VLKPKSPAARLRSGLSKPVPSVPALSSLATPAGRSPPRAKRSGVLPRHRTSRNSPYGRAAPSSLGLGLGGSASGNAAPFSLDSALKGTIPSYRSRQAARPKSKSSSSSSIFSSALGGQDLKASWFFDIHEDTAEQEMTNMLQHSTCVLDISSDEECESKDTIEMAQGRDKENIPPVDDVSQMSGARQPTPGAAAAAAAARSKTPDEMDLVKERRALGDLNAADFYAAGCDSLSVFVVPADEDAARKEAEVAEPEEAEEEEPEVEMESAEELTAASKPAAAALDRADSELFALWESGSAHGDIDEPQ
jgi:hypothetical protein